MLKKTAPHLIALLIFIAVSVFYFAPQYQGLAVRQGDDIQATGMTGGILTHIEQYGEHPQWAPNLFSGMPAYLVHMNYDGRIIKHINDFLYFLGTPAAYYFLLMAGFYMMLLCFGVHPYLGIVGALAYGLSSYFFIIFEAGHITKLIALAYVAPLIGSIYYAYARNIWLGAAMAGIFASIEISASHPQITYYFLFVVLGLIVAKAVMAYKQKQMPDFFKRSAVLLIAALLAVGSNLIQLWYIADYGKDSTRGKKELVVGADKSSSQQADGLDKEYITQWSYGKMETFNLFIPNAYGGTSSGGFSEKGPVADALTKYNAVSYAPLLPGYWGDMPFTSGPVYVGAVVVFLFCLGLFLLKGATLWWLVAVSLLGVFLAWGKNMMWLTDLFIDYMPGYNKFRTVSMILVIVEWSMPLVGVLVLKKIWDGSYDKAYLWNALKKSVAITGGIALFFIVLGGALFDFVSSSDLSLGLPEDVVAAMPVERASMMRLDAFRSLLFVLLTATCIWLFVKERMGKAMLAISLSVLVLCDMIPVNKRYLNNDDFQPVRQAKAIEPTAADRAILQDTTLSYRVANLSLSTFQDATTSYFHKSVGGYHAAKLGRYQDFIERYLSKMDIDKYSLLNTKYFIVPGENDAPARVQINPNALGNAWFVDSVDFVDGAVAELEGIDDKDLRRIAVVDRSFESLLQQEVLHASDSSAFVVLVDERANFLRYKTQNSVAAVAVFSEIYYPKGWVATIDGQEVPQFRADYLLRALVIPAGEHIVEFKFEAPHFTLLKSTTMASSLLLLGLFVVGVVVSLKKRF